MARLVMRTAHRPYLLRREGLDESVAICACGLSADQPFCDGSHKRTRGEEPGRVYIYTAAGGRTPVSPDAIPTTDLAGPADAAPRPPAR